MSQNLKECICDINLSLKSLTVNAYIVSRDFTRCYEDDFIDNNLCKTQFYHRFVDRVLAVICWKVG